MLARTNDGTVEPVSKRVCAACAPVHKHACRIGEHQPLTIPKATQFDAQHSLLPSLLLLLSLPRWPASHSESDIVANDVRCVLCGPDRADLGQFRISERAYLMRFASIFAMRDCALRRMRRHLAIVEADLRFVRIGLSARIIANARATRRPTELYDRWRVCVAIGCVFGAWRTSPKPWQSKARLGNCGMYGRRTSVQIIRMLSHPQQPLAGPPRIALFTLQHNNQP